MSAKSSVEEDDWITAIKQSLEIVRKIYVSFIDQILKVKVEYFLFRPNIYPTKIQFYFSPGASTSC